MGLVEASFMINPFRTILGNMIFLLACAAMVQMAPLFYSR